MHFLRVIAAAAILVMPAPAFSADEVIEAIDQARKAYQGGDLAGAKQSLDLASQLIGQKNADTFGKLLPAPPGWKAGDVQNDRRSAPSGSARRPRAATTTMPRATMSRCRSPAIPAIVMQYAAVLSNPAIGGFPVVGGRALDRLLAGPPDGRRRRGGLDAERPGLLGLMPRVDALRRAVRLTLGFGLPGLAFGLGTGVGLTTLVRLGGRLQHRTSTTTSSSRSAS